MPRNMADDTINFKSYLQTSIDFFSGPEIIANAKKSGRKIGSLTFPFPELFIGGGVVPLFLPRLDLKNQKNYNIIKTALSAKNLLGMGNIARGLDFLKNVDSSGTVKKIAGNVINQMIDDLNNVYENAIKVGSDAGMPIDHCYGARALYGIYKKWGREIDLNLGIDIRCSVFFNYHESLMINNYVKDEFIFDMPYSDTPRGVDFFEEEINNFIQHQEKITGKRFNMERFRNVLELSNDVKKHLNEIFFKILPGDIIPCSPATLSELNSLLVYSNIDFNSVLKGYEANLKNMVQEMYDRIDQPAKRFDATGYPKLFYTPMFGGFEPEIATFADELGARVYYPEWKVYGVLEPVKTSGNLIRNYAENLMNFQQGIGFNSAQMAKSLINAADRMGIDGIIFCEVFGCRSMCTGHKMLKDMIREANKDIPVNVVTFNNMGDSLGQVKTRVSAFIEMIKGN